jgi:hypothetical protein
MCLAGVVACARNFGDGIWKTKDGNFPLQFDTASLLNQVSFDTYVRVVSLYRRFAINVIEIDSSGVTKALSFSDPSLSRLRHMYK